MKTRIAPFMAIQLTSEQEQRIQAVVDAGTYSSVEEALNAALFAVESAAALGFEGTQEDLEALLLAGLASREVPEDEFWESVDRETNAMLAAHKPGPRV